MKQSLRYAKQNGFSKYDIERVKAAARSALEPLEGRLLFSGDVLASVSHGTLTVRGDSAANSVVLDQVGLSAGQVRITADSTTDINKQADPVILSGITRGASIKLGSGADSIALDNLSLAGNAIVNTQGGGATITVDNVQVAGSLTLQNGAALGTSTTIDNTTISGNLTVVAASNGQHIALQSVDVQHNTRIDGGNGASLLTIDDSTFHGSTQLTTGRKSDTIQIDANGSPVGAPTTFDGTVLINLGAGNDTLQLGVAGQAGDSSVFAGKTHFSGKIGHDTFLEFNATSFSGNGRFRIDGFESTAAPLETIPPIVNSSSPPDHATAIALNRAVSATFSEAMDPLTITTADVVLTAPGNIVVPGTVAYVGTTATFTPTAALTANTLYTLTITTAATDLAGNHLTANFTSTFTTGASSDFIAPTVTATNPANLQTGVAINKTVAATFSEDMDPLTINAATVAVTAPGGISVLGTIGYVGTTMTFTPTLPLARNTVYALTITTGAKDLAGNPLATTFNSTFTTGATADTTAPTVSSTDPANNAVGVALNRAVAATFSEAMDPSTISAADVTLTAPGNVSVLGAVTYVGTTMTFTPSATLAPNTPFILTTTTRAKDLAGNPLAANFTSTFTTGATPDTTAPTVTAITPADLQTNVFINKTVVATFSEAMKPSTINTATVTLTGPGITPVTGSVSYDVPSNTVTFTPSANLAPSTTFTATIAGGINGVTDLAGNPLLADKVWTFTTGTQIAQAPILLGRAGPFAILATASTTGSGNQIVGNVGLHTGTAQGIPPSEITGTVDVNDQAVINAQADLLAAFNDAVSRSTTPLPLAGNIGGLTITPGLYVNSSSVMIQGSGSSNNVTLDAQGDPNAIFIFKMGSTLLADVGSHVILAGGAKAGNIYWEVGSSATINNGVTFAGNILASATITVNTGSVITGRLLGGSSTAGSVNVTGSSVTIPAP